MKETEQATYKLSEDERGKLLQENVESLSNTLSGYQMNSELQLAWISAIVPPRDTQEHAPQTTEKISVEFILPSNDTFWETFNFPDKRWPEENEFRQFIEMLGYHSPENLSELIGTEVNVSYDETKSSWVANRPTNENANPTSNHDSSQLSSTQLYKLAIAIAIGFPVSALLLLRLRHFSLPIIGLGVLLAYLIVSE